MKRERKGRNVRLTENDTCQKQRELLQEKTQQDFLKIGKQIIQKLHMRVRTVRAAKPHRQTDIGSLKGWSIIGTVTSHSDYFTHTTCSLCEKLRCEEMKGVVRRDRLKDFEIEWKWVGVRGQ